MGRALRLLYGMNRQSNTPQKATAAVTELDSLLNEWLSDVPEHLKWFVHLHFKVPELQC